MGDSFDASVGRVRAPSTAVMVSLVDEHEVHPELAGEAGAVAGRGAVGQLERAQPITWARAACPTASR